VLVRLDVFLYLCNLRLLLINEFSVVAGMELEVHDLNVLGPQDVEKVGVVQGVALEQQGPKRENIETVIASTAADRHFPPLDG
jgi:hypothetical protein